MNEFRDILIRLREEDPSDLQEDAAREIERLRLLVMHYEAIAAAMRGTVMGTLEADDDFSVADAPSSTPR